MSWDETHIRHCLIYEFRSGSSATTAHKNILKAYPDCGLNVRKCQRWFSKFSSGDFDISERRGGSTSNFDEEALLAVIEDDPTLTTRQLGEYFEVSNSTIGLHLQGIGKVNKEGAWVPHDLSERNKLARSSICSSLLSRFKKVNFLKQIITADEKWILYANVQRKKQWLTPGQKPQPTPKSGLHPKKIMLSIWWDYRGVVHYELLPSNQTITADIYCAQLDRVAAALQKLRPGLINRGNVILQHDNARPHTARITVAKIRQLDWEVLPHPAYSPDIAPSDYHLFRSLQNFLNGQQFSEEADVKNALHDFFESKSPSFYESGILNLPLRWQQVIDNDGNYFN
jgi:[histone H3]-lysine36 N-dimethyltransferase SETMAR